MVTYLEQFYRAILYLERFDKGLRKQPNDYLALKESLEAFWDQREHETYDLTLKLINTIGKNMIDSIGSDILINKCHAISHSLRLNYYGYPAINKPIVDITIGNVFYKDDNLYNLSKAKLKRIITEGPSTNKALDVHVWLTMENMTVIDPTIMRTLVHRDEIPIRKYEEDPILIWREDVSSDFRYEPMLVDNEFFYRVDKE